MPRPSNWDDLVREHLSDGRIVAHGELLAMGIPKASLVRLLARGILEQPTRGLYALPSAPSDPLTVLAKLYGGKPQEPHGVLCLQVAAHIHELTDMGIWNIQRPEVAFSVAVNRRMTGRETARIISLHSMYSLSEVEWHEFGMHGIHVTNPVRTVCDLYAPWAGSLGEGVAREALARLANRDFTLAEASVAKAFQCGWGREITRDLESMNQFTRYQEVDTDTMTGIKL